MNDEELAAADAEMAEDTKQLKRRGYRAGKALQPPAPADPYWTRQVATWEPLAPTWAPPEAMDDEQPDSAIPQVPRPVQIASPLCASPFQRASS